MADDGNALELSTEHEGMVTLEVDGAEGVALWIMTDEKNDETWLKFTHEEVAKIMLWLQDTFAASAPRHFTSITPED